MTSYRETFSVADRGEFALLAVAALAEMLRHSIATGEDMSRHSDGINFLFEPHLDSLQQATLALREHQTRAAESVASSAAESARVHGVRRDLIASAVGNGVQPGEIAAAFNMSRSKIDRVIAQLRGEAEAESASQRMAG